MPPPHDGNELLPFADLIKLEKIDSVTFKSIALPFSPGGQLDAAVPRAYGGHPYAQAAWAACQTVEEGFLLYVCEYRDVDMAGDATVSSCVSGSGTSDRPRIVLATFTCLLRELYPSYTKSPRSGTVDPT